MATADKSIDSRVLEAAREEFLSKPYEKVSLRGICAKAGVTTGAFYNRYGNKEELFDALVTPTTALIREYCERTEKDSYTWLENHELDKIWELTPENQSRNINMIYDHYEGFRLLLCHAEGTKYDNYLHDFTCDVTARSYRFIEQAYRRGIISFLIDEEELHMLMTAYWSTMFEPLIHGLSREKALQHSAVVAKLFDWSAVLGF